MKKKLALVLTTVTLSMSLLVGCSASSNNVLESTETVAETPTATQEPTTEPTEEAPHEHTYTETITTEATCETDGEATYTCECGDTYTEPIATQGHVFETYTSNNDATFTADGTETAKCKTCDVTDTRTAEGSMLTYTYTDMDSTMYAQKTVNVRSMPSTDGEKLGSLSTNDEVKVTGQCAETSWYRIEYSGSVAYVSNSYLGNDKVVVEQPKTEQTQTSNGNGVFPYESYKIYDDGGTHVYFYYPLDASYGTPEAGAAYQRCCDEMHAIWRVRYPSYSYVSNWTWENIGTYNGVKYIKAYHKEVYDANMNVLGTW